AGPARRLLAGRAVRAGLEVQVTETTVTALGQQTLFTVLQQFHDQLTGLPVADHGAHGHAQHDVFGSGAELVGAAALFAVARNVLACVAVIDQGVDVAIGHHIDVPAPPAVAAIGAAEGDEFFATEADAAIAAIACGHVNGGFVNKFHGGVLVVSMQKAPAGRGFACGAAPQAGADKWLRFGQTGVTTTNLRFSAPLTVNDTVPSTSANRVWSRPRPTLLPAWKRVPR